MRSAESLTEREHQNAKEELVELRKKVQDADQEIDGLHLTIEMNEQNFQCIWQIARPCVVFSLNLADQWSNKQTREMRQLLDDHPVSDFRPFFVIIMTACRMVKPQWVAIFKCTIRRLPPLDATSTNGHIGPQRSTCRYANGPCSSTHLLRRHA